MPAGLQVFNDSNTVQIDQDYANFALRSKGSVSMVLDNQTHPQPMRVGTVTVAANFPIIAFAAAGHRVNLTYMTNNGNGTFTFYFRSQSTSNYTLYWWLFDTATYAEAISETLGLQVFKGDGTLAYHSSMKPLRIVGVYRPTTPTPQPGTLGQASVENITVPNGRIYAAVQSGLCYRPLSKIDSYGGTSQGSAQQAPDDGSTPPPNSNDLWRWMTLEGWHSTALVNPSGVEVGLTRFEFFQGEYPPGTNESDEVYGDLQFFLVDVTGYGIDLPSSTNDSTPAAMNWANMSGSTIEDALVLSNSALTVSGINVPVLLKAEVISYSGNLTGGYLRMIKNGAEAAKTFNIASGSIEATVNSGDSVYFQYQGYTGAGIKSANATIRVSNSTNNGEVLDTFTVAMTVDSDNNFVAPDYTVNAVNWANISWSTASNAGQGNNAAQTIQGITRTVTLRTTITGLSSDMHTAYLDMYVNGSYRNRVTLANNAYMEANVNNGDTVYFLSYGETSSGLRTSNYTATISNVTAGQTLDSFTVAATVDSDNNYNNAVDYQPNAMDWTTIFHSYTSTQGSSSTPNYASNNTIQIAGLTNGASIQLAFNASSISGDAGIDVECVKNGVIQGVVLRSAENTTGVTKPLTSVTVANGDTIGFRAVVYGAGATSLNTMVSKSKGLTVSVLNATLSNATLDSFDVSMSYTDNWDSGDGGGGGPIRV